MVNDEGVRWHEALNGKKTQKSQRRVWEKEVGSGCFQKKIKRGDLLDVYVEELLEVERDLKNTIV